MIQYIQPPDTFSNEPFKDCILEFYAELLASGMYYYTKAGNMKSATGNLIVSWILEA